MLWPCQVAKQLADCVIPNEYGIDPPGKMRIGSKICCALLGKLLADLANMREESIATAVRFLLNGSQCSGLPACSLQPHTPRGNGMLPHVGLALVCMYPPHVSLVLDVDASVKVLHVVSAALLQPHAHLERCNSRDQLAASPQRCRQ